MPTYYPPPGGGYPQSDRANRYPGHTNRYPGHTNRYPLRAVPPGNPFLYFNAANIDGSNNNTLSDADPVGTWTNLGSLGNGGNLVQAVSGSRPTYRASHADLGSPGVEFDGTDDFLVTAAFAANQAQPTKHVFVFEQDNVSTARYLMDGIDGTDRHVVQIDTTSEVMPWAGSFGNSGENISLNAKQVAIVHIDGAASYVRLNGSQSGTLSVGTRALGGITLGCYFTGGGFNFDGAFRAYFAYSGTVPTDAEIEAFTDTL